MERISRHRLNIEIAKLISQRGTCNRAKVGCVIVKEGRIVSTGYVGSPSGLPHCIDDGCIIGEDGGCVRTVHAEAGAIAFAAKAGISLQESIMYVTLSPCLSCSKLIINAGIRRVIFLEQYRKTDGIELLNMAGIEVNRYDEESDKCLKI
ncbi:MAG: dCMP deaminase family protein [Bacilli bacterium]